MAEETSFKKRKENQEETDWISSLPDTLLYQILLLLDMKSAARTSTLSKRWSSLWSNFQIVDLNDQHWNTNQPPEIRRPKFLECLQLTMERRNLSDLSMLRIQFQRLDEGDMDSLLDELIVRALSGNLQTLVLNFEATNHFIPEGQSQCNACYKLPEIIFDSGLHLDILSIDGCQFRASYTGINLRALTILVLKKVHISDVMLMALIAHCPSIDSVTISHCMELKVFRVVNPKLKSIFIDNCRELDSFEMDLPGLKTFHYTAFHSNNRNNIVRGEIRRFGRYNNNNNNIIIIDRKMKTDNDFLSLTRLDLTHIRFTVEIFELIISCFPNLKIMIFRACAFSGRPRLIAPKLQSLQFEDCVFEENMDIFCPKIKFMAHVMNLNFRIHVFHPQDAHNMFLCLTTFKLEGNIELSEESIKDMLNNFSALKNLTLMGCTGFKELKISSSSLEKLTVEECKDMEEADINAPSLVHFTYIGPILWLSRVVASDELHVEIFLSNFNNRLRMNYFSLPFDGLRNLLWKFDQARLITLECDFRKGYHRDRAMIDPTSVSTSIPLYFLKYLEIKTSITQIGYIDLLCGLFELSFCIGILVIDLETRSIKLKFEEDPAKEADDETGIPYSGRYVHDCIRDHLFEVEMDNFEGKDEEMELVKFLLDKVVNLKSMSISFNVETYQKNMDSCLRMIEAVKSFFKTSPTAEVVCS